MKDIDGNILRIDVNDENINNYVGINKGLKFNHKFKICPHCGFKGSGPSIQKYHFKNCIKNPNIKIVSCPHCGKIGPLHHINQHHFEKCKLNLKSSYIRKNKHVLKKCPHCGIEGKGGNMTRYHFDNCKFKS